jgi:hypothetical protein
MARKSELSPEAADGMISAAVRALAAGRSIKHAKVAEAIKMAQSTFERRLSHGGWTAAEVAALSVYFKAAPESLMTGLDGHLAPPE